MISKNIKASIYIFITIIALVCLSCVLNSHLLEIAGDNDDDYIADPDEPYFNLKIGISDSDGDGLKDGIEVALELSKRIEVLPRQKSDSMPYAIEHIAYCVAVCPVCDEEVNGGGIVVINPLKNISDTIPFIGLHYLSYGCFRYEWEQSEPGYLQHGEVDPVQLDKTLR